MLLDGNTATALVDNGADYSVISGPFPAKLKKVKPIVGRSSYPDSWRTPYNTGYNLQSNS